MAEEYNDRSVHEYGKFDSWEILDNNTARKKCDKSFFLYDGSAVPISVRWFFGAENINPGERIELVLVYHRFEFDAHIIKSDNGLNQARIFWDKALGEEIKSYAEDGKQHVFEFRRIEKNRFEVEFVDEANAHKAWLLTWNKNNWKWDDFYSICEGTKAGQTIHDSWACVSTAPKIGDEVFLIKLGELPRGIIGHGRVERESFEKAHYNAAKAAEGKRIKAIGVEFDRIINYEKDKFISQEELTTKCGAQYWSPQASGIEIKPEVLPTLHEMWEAATTVEKYGITKIVSFLKEFAGKHYKAPLRAGDQADYMSEMKDRGQEARQLFIDFIKDAITDIPGLEFASCSNWVNQGQVVQRYIWVELKRKEWWNYPNSVSISIEKREELFGNEIGITVRAETKDIASKDEDLKRQFRLLDCDLLDGMTYLVKDNRGELHYNESDTEALRELYETGAIIKLEIIEVIEKLNRNESVILSETKDAIKEIYPLYEYVMSDTEKPDEDGWWPSLEEYDPGITSDEYVKYFTTEKIVKRTWLEALYELCMMPDHTASCKQLGDRYGHSPSHYISYYSSAAQNIQKVTGIGSPRDDKNAKCWPILFQGKLTKAGYTYRMRKPVVTAMSMLMSMGVFLKKENKGMAQFDHNLILFGPPGTGKTYHSVIYAVAICEGRELDEVKKEPYSEVMSRYRELKEDGRIAFTTFHQSYGYEEFIEGIKPKLNSDDDSLGYIIEDGVFKGFCKHARSVKVQRAGNLTMKAQPRIWGMLLGGTGMTELKIRCFANNEIRIGFTEVNDDEVEADIIGDSTASWQAKHMVYDFKYTVEIGDIVVIEKDNRSIDAIGVVTGEYQFDPADEKYPRSRTVKWLAKGIDQDVIQFLPNGRKQLSRFSLFAFDYLGIDTITQILNENTIVPVMEVDQETKPYVFVIDEINRGNISKIFGELITLIEDSKRAGAAEAMEATLPYSGESFSVPNNVYILGTMNTADRSIALMDTALRRRFEFVEMMPNSEVLESLGVGTIVVDGEELNVARMLDVINERIEFLFDREHTIGHAFFTKLANDPSIDTLASVFEKNVIPLLQEYFYEDYEKIQMVLGDNDDQKEDEYKFILDKKVELKQIFKGNPDIDLPPKRYSIQRSAFRKLQSYKQIGKDL